MRKTTFTICLLLLPCLIAGAQVYDFTPRIPATEEFTKVRTLFSAADTVEITIVGDVMLHTAQIENCFARYAAANPGANPLNADNYDFTPCLGGIRDMLQSADIAVANMEFTLAGAPFSGYPAFCAPDTYADYVADCGVDVFLTANNHILDKGSKGALRTLEKYGKMRARGISDTGCFADSLSMKEGYPLIVEEKGIRIAFVNFTYGTNVNTGDTYPKVCGMDKKEIAAAMQTARENADIVIVLPHWGIEYALKHSDSQKKMAEFLVRRGADAIIGSHPHVVQDIDSLMALNGEIVPVVYSLGNIISNMSATNTQIGLAVTIPVIRTRDGKCRVGEVKYTFTWCSLPGRLTGCHVTIPVREYIGCRSEWLDPADYDKMISTYNRIRNTSGIGRTDEQDN